MAQITNLRKLNQFIIRVGRIHIGNKELSGSSIDYRKAGLALIDQGISDTLCSMDPDFIPWGIVGQVEAFFVFLDRHIHDDLGFQELKPEAVPDRIVEDLPEDLLGFLDDFLLAADAYAQRLQNMIY